MAPSMHDPLERLPPFAANSLPHPNQVTALHFDARQELVWAGLHTGDVCSFVYPRYERYTARHAHFHPSTGILSDVRHGRGLFLVSPYDLRLMPRNASTFYWTLGYAAPPLAANYRTRPMNGAATKHANELAADSLLSVSHSSAYAANELLVSTSRASVHSVSCERGTVVREILCGQFATTHMAPCGAQTVAAALLSGALEVVDTRMGKDARAASVAVHAGPFSDIAAIPLSNTVVTCGFHLNIPQVSFVDLRAMAVVSSLNLRVHLLRTLPEVSNMVVGASLGAVFCIDSALATVVSSTRLDNAATALAVSLSNDLVAVGDIHGCVQMFSARTLCEGGVVNASSAKPLAVNHLSDPIEVPSALPKSPVCVHWSAIDDSNVALSAELGLPNYDSPLLSGLWPPLLQHSASLPRAHVDVSVIDTVRSTDTVAITNIPDGVPPNLWPYRASAPTGHFKSTRVSTSLPQSLSPGTGSPASLFRQTTLPGVNSPHGMQSGLRGKHGAQMRTPRGSGLAASSLSHSGEAGASLLGATDAQMSEDLMEMSIDRPGRAVLRGGDEDSTRDYALFRVEYSRFGVLDFDFEYFNETPYSGLESGLQSSYVNSYLQLLYFSRPFCISAIEHSVSSCQREACLLCESGFLYRMLQQSRPRSCCLAANWLSVFENTRHAVSLGLVESPNVPFQSLSATMQHCARFLLEHFKTESCKDDALLDYSMDVRTTLTCPTCNDTSTTASSIFSVDFLYAQDTKYSTDSQGSVLYNLVAQSLSGIPKIRSWCSKCKKFVMKTSQRHVAKMPKVLQITSSAGQNWNNEWWCSKENKFTPSSCQQQQQHLLDGFRLVLDEQGNPLVTSAQEDTPEDEVYMLTGLVSEISITGSRPHLVSQILVNGEWYLFNDFRVKAIPGYHVNQFPSWKTPSVLHFTRKSGYNMQIRELLLSPTWDVTNKTFLQQCVTGKKRARQLAHPITFAELLPGCMYAIDCEFVSLREEIAEFSSEGKKQIVSPCQLSLARVSVVRASGPLKGTVCIDDYIVPRYHIVDYLTEFSGIVAEDLDPALSTHHLVSLKTAYQKLRLMVDSKVTFVGHGLAQDFRILNIHVPPEQVVDTVEIYHIRAMQRKLALKFLMWGVLGADIQQKNHDSVEDAKAALALYDEHVEAVENRVWDALLKEVYRIGKQCRFKASSRPPPRTAKAAVNAQLQIVCEKRSSSETDIKIETPFSTPMTTPDKL